MDQLPRRLAAGLSVLTHSPVLSAAAGRVTTADAEWLADDVIVAVDDPSQLVPTASATTVAGADDLVLRGRRPAAPAHHAPGVTGRAPGQRRRHERRGAVVRTGRSAPDRGLSGRVPRLRGGRAVGPRGCSADARRRARGARADRPLPDRRRASGGRRRVDRRRSAPASSWPGITGRVRASTAPWPAVGGPRSSWAPEGLPGARRLTAAGGRRAGQGSVPSTRGHASSVPVAVASGSCRRVRCRSRRVRAAGQPPQGPMSSTSPGARSSPTRSGRWERASSPRCPGWSSPTT